MQALRNLRDLESNRALTIQKLWRKAIARMLKERLRRHAIFVVSPGFRKYNNQPKIMIP